MSARRFAASRRCRSSCSRLRSTEDDKLLGLELGADDYVTKPFSPREAGRPVCASCCAGSSCRRTRSSRARSVLDPAARELVVRGEPVAVTAAEFRLIETLMRAPGRVFSRDELMQRALGDSYDRLDRTIDVHIKNLRKKDRG